MKRNKSNESFWPSYVDVMTNLFAITLVLFIISFFWFKGNLNELNVLKEEYLRIQEMNRALQSLDNNPHFQYNSKYQKHILKHHVEFIPDEYAIPDGLKEVDIIQTLHEVGESLLQTIVRLRNEYINKEEAPFRIKFLIIIEGQASRSGKEYHNYLLSYQRALSLKMLWEQGAFSIAPKELNCELIVSGSGWYGSPREEEWLSNGKENPANQRFLVHIVPVIDWHNEK